MTKRNGDIRAGMIARSVEAKTEWRVIELTRRGKIPHVRVQKRIGRTVIDDSDMLSVGEFREWLEAGIKARILYIR